MPMVTMAMRQKVDIAAIVSYGRGITSLSACCESMQVYVNVKLSVVLNTLLRNESKTKAIVTKLNKEMKTRYECKQTASLFTSSEAYNFEVVALIQ